MGITARNRPKSTGTDDLRFLPVGRSLIQPSRNSWKAGQNGGNPEVAHHIRTKRRPCDLSGAEAYPILDEAMMLTDQRIGQCLNPGGESSKVLQDCTTCVSCLWAGTLLDRAA